MKTQSNTTSLAGLQKIVLVVFFIGIASYSQAQFQYGFKVNGGFACQSDLLEIANNCDVRFSPGIGLISKYQFTDAVALKTGLEYQQKGREFDENNIELSNKLHYLTLPVKAEFSAGEKAGFKNGQKLFFAIGPYFSYLLNASEELNNTSFDLMDDSKTFDVGLGFELGFEFPVFTNKALQVGLNYDMGFVEIYKSEPNLHNKMASLSLGFLF